MSRAEILAECEQLEREVEQRLTEVWRCYWAAMMLAADPETCAALLDGLDVPAHRLDPHWISRLPTFTASVRLTPTIVQALNLWAGEPAAAPRPTARSEYPPSSGPPRIYPPRA